MDFFDRKLSSPICLEHSMFVCLFICLFSSPWFFFYMLKTCFEWVFSMKKRFFYIGWLCVCVRLFFIFFLSSKIFFQIWKINHSNSEKRVAIWHISNILKGQLISEHILLLFHKTTFLDNFWLFFWSSYVSGKICCGIIWPLENTSYLKVRVKFLSKLSSTITVSNIFFIKPTPYLRILTQTIKVSNSYCL